MTSPETTDQARTSEANWLSKVLLALYLLTLVWLTLFKLSYDIPTIVAEHRTRSLNLVPFVLLGQPGLSVTGLSETLSNFVTFIPFGLLLEVNVKKAPWWRLAPVVLVFSVTVEALQFVLAIGTSDATDVATNTLGGLTGLLLYRLADRGMRTEALDRVIAATGVALFVTFVLLRLLFFKVATDAAFANR